MPYFGSIRCKYVTSQTSRLWSKIKNKKSRRSPRPAPHLPTLSHPGFVYNNLLTKSFTFGNMVKTMLFPKHVGYAIKTSSSSHKATRASLCADFIVICMFFFFFDARTYRLWHPLGCAVNRLVVSTAHVFILATSMTTCMAASLESAAGTRLKSSAIVSGIHQHDIHFTMLTYA